MALRKNLTKAIAAIAIVFILLFMFYQFWFLRMPERIIPEGNSIVSPANGVVKDLIEIKDREPVNIEKGLFGKFSLITNDTIDNGFVIVIAMNIFNAHYQKAPLDGLVKEISYTKGSFINALDDGLDATLNNERNSITIETQIGKVKVVQVAGYVARRIESFVKEGDDVKKGSTIGLIRLGSQVVIVTPKVRLKVKKGDKVVDGQTIIADF